MLGTGWVVLTEYGSAPGQIGLAPAQLPLAHSSNRTADLPTLIMFAHPKCPCTRASIGELEILVSRLQEKVRAHVFFYKPSGEQDAWAQTDLWRHAGRLPAVSVHVDEEGKEAARFGALVSGQVVLYGPGDNLLFAGGITGARGHAGDNQGRQAVLDWILKGQSEHVQTHVFGCAINKNTNSQGTI